MKWNMNNEQRESGNYEVGKRYVLVVAAAEDKFSKDKGTPLLHLKFENEQLEDAYDKKLYNTEKAAYRMIEWAKALGFPCEGDIELDPANMVGIRFTAECGRTKPNNEGKTYTEWIKPMPIIVGGHKAKAAPAAQKHPAAAMAPVNPPREESDDQTVPF